MPAANATAEAAINRRSGFTVEFSDFVIPITLGQTGKRAAYFLQMCF
jgi:hypothetical protein